MSNNHGRDSGSPGVTILVAIIGAIGVIVAAWIGRNTGFSQGQEQAFTRGQAQEASVREVVVTRIVEVTRVISVTVTQDSVISVAAATLVTPSPEQLTTPTSTTLPTPSATETPVPTPTFTETPIPTTTPTPSVTPIPLTAPDSILENGETWYANGWSLTVTNFTYHTYNRPHFELRNLSDRQVVFPAVEWDTAKIYFDNVDSYGMPCRDAAFGQQIIEGRGKIEWTWQFACGDGPGPMYSFRGDYPPGARIITLVVENLGDIIVNARWQTEIPRP